jgi:hypothetical protein
VNGKVTSSGIGRYVPVPHLDYNSESEELMNANAGFVYFRADFPAEFGLTRTRALAWWWLL